MESVLTTLENRGFIHQTTEDEKEASRKRLHELLSKPPVTMYIGFDPTAASLHVGSLVQIMALMHVQRAGHRVLAIVGGGTGLIGDPSGKMEMRQLLTREQVGENLRGIQAQLERYLDFSHGMAMVLDNAEWLVSLNYLEFLRDIGRHFSVNRMLSHDCFKTRYESTAGLSFLEFNYMLLQAYDFLELLRRYDCQIQLGGSDQWGNIVAGLELIRRADAKEAYGITIPLIETADGKKMGKTEAGAVWLDPNRTSPYDYYQFWINTHDQDVGRFLKLFTFLDLDEIVRLESLAGADIRQAKAVLAHEATKLTHGEAEATRAAEAAKALFGGKKGSGQVEALDMPSLELEGARLAEGVSVIDLCVEGGLSKSKREARQVAKQGGLYVNGSAVAEDYVVSSKDLSDDVIVLRSGKKRYLRVSTG